VILTKNYSGDGMKEDCVAVGGRKETPVGFWWGNRKKRDSVEDLCLRWSEILKWILKV
jgi:hypothetical protein